jgi:oligopeptide/dipeptide ABC transporter ATP-binding protein
MAERTLVSERSGGSVVLSIKGLTVRYDTFRGELTALSGVTLNVERSRVVAVVGESGCGKSTLGLSIIRLLPTPPARVVSGEMVYLGTDLLKSKESEITKLRGTGISMIFQEPLSSLDPVYTVGEQLTEAINVREGRRPTRNYGPFRTDLEPDKEDHRMVSRLVGFRLPRGKRKVGYAEEVIEALRKVQISDPERVVDKYPHELSGGMAQRVMIAGALLEKPTLLIADEPTSALDVTTQAQVLDLMRGLRDDLGSSILFITHDLAVAAQIADEIVVMYAGEIVEHAEVKKIFREPLHPYTEGLLQSFPRKYKDEGKLQAIAGDVPDLRRPPSGCRFHPRCKYVFDRCSKEHPPLLEVEEGRRVACFLRH